MASHNDLGKKGEALAASYLTERGYEILDENWVHKKAEIDLIAYHKQKIIFVEVKTRTSLAYGNPEDFVSLAKQQQMEIAANEYIEIMSHRGEIRFDIISILFKQDGRYEINHIEDAFWPE